jgi:putative ABC transport system permease protein
MPHWITFEMDYRAFAYFFVSCVLTGIAFGCFPALQISRTNVNHHLKEGARQASGSFRARRLASLLLVAEIALTTTLLAEAGLFMRGFLQSVRTEMGFDARHVVVAHVTLPWTKYRTDSERVAFVEAFMERLDRPGRAVTVAVEHPMSGAFPRALKLDGRDAASKTGAPTDVFTLPAHTGYFRALDVKLRLGRDFRPGDGAAGSEVAIVNESFVAKYWPSENPIGKRLRVGNDKAPWLEVVGVSPDIFQMGNIAIGPRPLVYLPFRLNPSQSFSVMAHTEDSGGSTAMEMRTEAAKLDPDLALHNVMNLDEEIRQDRLPYQVFTAIWGIFSVMALLMSSVGLYGVTAHGVSRRTQEIGIRAAVGATPVGVVWLVLKQSVLRVAAGLVLGLIGAALLGDLVEGILSPIPPRDPLTFTFIAALMASVALTACIVPAWRAARLTPADALRME